MTPVTTGALAITGGAALVAVLFAARRAGRSGIALRALNGNESKAGELL